MIRKILHRITDRLPCRIINGPDGEPYLERYYVGTVAGWRFYLHQFVGDDPDRGLHDHPWTRAFALVLAGFYIEQTRTGYRPVRWFNSLTGDTFHRVILPSSDTVWTLFAHRVGDVKEWGFLEKRVCLRVESRGKPVEYTEQVFTPYQYQNEGGRKPVEWWLTARTGAEVRRG